MKRQVVCLLALLGAELLTSCTHNLYPGKANKVDRLLLVDSHAQPVPVWVSSKTLSVRPSDGYFRIAAIPDGGATRPTQACLGKSTFWNSEQANYAVTVEPKDFRYWTSDIKYPVYNKVITASEEQICKGYRDFVYVLPWHPITLSNNERLLIHYKGESNQSLKLTNYMATAAGVAGLFSGGGAVSAFAAQETTKTAMTAINKAYKDITESSWEIGEPLLIKREDIQAGKYDYQLPMHYFKKGESEGKKAAALEDPKSTSILFRINFLVDYTRSIIGVGNDGTDNEIPKANFDNAEYYLTYSPNPQTTKSFLERISLPYPGILEKLKGPDTIGACRTARQFIKSAGYSPSDQGALYGALLYVASGYDENFQYKSRFYNTACQPPGEELWKLAYSVYPLNPPSSPTEEFTLRTFGEPDKELYVRILSDMAEGMSFNNRESAAWYIGPRLMKEVQFTSAGDFAGHSGPKTADEVIDELSQLGVSQIGCYMPAEHVEPTSPGPRLIILSSKSATKPIAGMITFTLDSQSKAISGVNIRNISSAMHSYIQSKDMAGNPYFVSTSKCADIVKKIAQGAEVAKVQ